MMDLIGHPHAKAMSIDYILSLWQQKSTLCTSVGKELESKGQAPMSELEF